MAFTQEQIQDILRVLEDPKYVVMNKPEIKVVYYLGIYTGQRLKDCVLLQWDKVDLRRERINIRQFKTEKDVTIPISLPLMEVLKEALKWRKPNGYVCPNVAVRYNKSDENGRNIGNGLVNIDVLRVIRWVGLEPSASVPGLKRRRIVYGFHSLRHAFASHAAESGIPKAVVTSILGADSGIIDKYYTHIGDEAQRQAILTLSGNIEKRPLEERIQLVLDYLKTNALDGEHFDKIKSILIK